MRNLYDFSGKKQHICKQFSVIKQLGPASQYKGWRMVNVRLCEIARQAAFSTRPRHFLDCESEAFECERETFSQNYSPGILVESQKELVQPFSQLLRIGWKWRFDYKLGLTFSRKFESYFIESQYQVTGRSSRNISNFVPQRPILRDKCQFDEN